MKRLTVAIVAAIVSGAAFADPASGWKQTGAGPYVYDDPANWVDGVVNGVFGSDLTLTAAQTITFTNDLSLADGLSIAYAGNYALTFQSNGTGAKTLTLGGDITANVSKNGASAHVTFGSETAADNLVFNLGGANRTFTQTATQNDPSKTGWMKIYATIQNGSVTYSGLGPIKVYGSNAYSGGTTLSNTGYIYMNNDACFGTGPVTIANVASSDNKQMPRLHCDVAVTIANEWILCGTFAFHGTATSFSGPITIDSPVSFLCESASLVINSPAITNSTGSSAIENFLKYGSKELKMYTPLTVANTQLTMGDGVWSLYGKISGSGLKVVGDARYNSFLWVYSSENDFTGKVTIDSPGGGKGCHVCFGTAGALPDDVTIGIYGAGVLRSAPTVGYSCGWYLQNERIAKDSTGTLCVGDNNEKEAVDFTQYPELGFGASGNFTFNNAITPANGVYRIRTSGGNFTIGALNALTGDNDVVIYGQGNTVYLTNGNDISGTITLEGGSLCLQNANGTAPNASIVVKAQRTLFLYDSKSSGKVRVKNVRLVNGVLDVQGSTSYDLMQTVSGTLTVDGSEGGVGIVRFSSNNAKSVALTVGRLVFTASGVLGIDGDGLGATPGANACNFFVEEPPALVGGGGARGSKTISILPRAIGATQRSGIESGKLVQSFVTYESDVGFRPLDLEAEYESTLSGVSQYANVRLPYGATTEISSSGTVNSLLFQGGSGSSVSQLAVAEGAANVLLTVTSGQMICGQRGGVVNSDYCSAPVHFGSSTAVAWYGANALQYFSGAISGTGGIVLAQAQQTFGPNRYLIFSSGDSSISGDLYVLVDGALYNSAIPHGDRIGDIHVVKNARLFIRKNTTANGLFGEGEIRNSESGGIDLVFGRNDTNGDFGGAFTGNTSLEKVGAGRQRFYGTVAHNRATTVSAGVLQLDGSFTASAVTVASGATLAGCGTFGQGVTLADGAKLEVGSAQLGADDAVMNFDGGLALSGNAAATFKVLGNDAVASFVASSVTGTGTITVSLDSGALKTGDYLLAKSDAAIPFAYARGVNCGPLSLRNNSTELWMTKSAGLSVIVR